MKVDWRTAYLFYLAFTGVLLVPAVTAPMFALLKIDSAAAVMYQALKPLCHQYIYRSYCIIEHNNTLSFDECIPKGKENESFIQTKYTNRVSSMEKFVYSRYDIGVNRAEYVERDGKKGYKFGVCARDLFQYIGLLAAALIYLPLRKKVKSMPSALYIVIAILPLAIDGTGQLIGLWEGLNSMRAITGFIAGTVLGYYILFLLADIFESMRNRA